MFVCVCVSDVRVRACQSVYLCACVRRTRVCVSHVTCGGSFPLEGEGALLEEAREVGLAWGGASLREGGILSRPFSLEE